MKRLTAIFIALLVCFAWTASSSAQQGTVIYEEVTKMNIELPPEMEHMRDQIPDSHTATRQLFFDETASLMKNAPAEAPETTEMQTVHEGMIRFQTQREENETYFDFDEDRRIEKRDFMGRTFLITGDLSDLPWRLTEERSEFLGYMCQKAIVTKDSTTYEAWFTPEISVPAGPGIGGLPGLILVLNIDDGQRSFVAKEVSLEPVENGAIVPPKKGREVTQAEFDAIVAEKMKEMDMTRSGNGTFILRMDH